MKLKIGDFAFEASPSFLTLVRYRAEYGTSFLEDITKGGDPFELFVRLLYEAIRGKRPYFHSFRASCLADKNFSASFNKFFRRLVLRDSACPATEKRRGEPFDELELLAMCAVAQIPGELLDLLNVFQLSQVIGKYAAIKAGKQKPHELQEEERKALYGITAEQEESIEAYLMEHPELIAAEERG